MFFKKKRRKIPTRPDVAAVNRIIVVCLIAGYVFNSVKHHSITPPVDTGEIKKSIAEALPSIPAGYTNFTSLFPTSTPVVTVKDVEPGTGTPAVCGQQVTIAYTVSGNGKMLPDSAPKDKPFTFRIGEHTAIPALEQALVGMAKGGKRTVTSPARLAYDRKDVIGKNPPTAPVLFNVELLDIKPALPDLKDNPFRITEVQRGAGHLILCGVPASVHITLWDLAGNKLYSTHDKDNKPISFITGQSEVFLGLEQGVIGMGIKGKRSLIVPPSFQKTMDGNAPKVEIPFPAKQTVLVDVEAMP